MKTILAWGDSPTSTTGMGKVNQEILSKLAKTGEFEITVVGIHFDGGYSVDTNRYPYHMIVADPDKRDMLGRNTFLRILASRKWDIVFTHQDLANINSICKHILQIKAETNFKWIVYSPVDNDQLIYSDLECMRNADFSATYSEFGKKVVDEIDRRIKVETMWLGTDLSKFYPASKEEKKLFRKEIFGIEDDIFLVVNVNANRPRKDLPRTILAFSLFNNEHKNSALYLHAPQVDFGGDLERISEITNTSKGRIYLNPNLHSTQGLDENLMRKVYCSADVVVSTSLAEGWGLSCTEAFACGIPAVFPNHTSLREIVGIGFERGQLIKIQDSRFFDWTIGNVWFPVCDEDHCSKLLAVTKNFPDLVEPKTKAALEWVKEHTWEIITDKWIKVFKGEL